MLNVSGVLSWSGGEFQPDLWQPNGIRARHVLSAPLDLSGNGHYSCA